MSAINQEKLVEEQPRPVSIEGTREILSQMENCTCIIYKEDGKKGTGFFCKIPFLNNLLPVLITNNHILDENDIENNKIINLGINNKVKKLKIDNSRKKYTNPDENIDITIIEIRQYKDGIYKFLEVDKTDIYKNKEKIELEYKMKSIYVLHYPKEKLNVSYGLMKDIIDNQKINHYCNTEEGSSGAPILSLETFKIIGIHYGCHSGNIIINYGVNIKYIIDLFNNFNKNKIKNEIKKIYKNIITGDNNSIKITVYSNHHTISNKNISKKNNTNFRENTNTKYNTHNIMKSEKNTPSNINNNHFEFKSLKKERNFKNTFYKRSSIIPNNEILNKSEDLNSHIQNKLSNIITKFGKYNHRTIIDPNPPTITDINNSRKYSINSNRNHDIKYSDHDIIKIRKKNNLNIDMEPKNLWKMNSRNFPSNRIESRKIDFKSQSQNIYPINFTENEDIKKSKNSFIIKQENKIINITQMEKREEKNIIKDFERKKNSKIIL